MFREVTRTRRHHPPVSRSIRRRARQTMICHVRPRIGIRHTATPPGRPLRAGCAVHIPPWPCLRAPRDSGWIIWRYAAAPECPALIAAAPREAATRAHARETSYMRARPGGRARPQISLGKSFKELKRFLFSIRRAIVPVDWLLVN
jgi:hypothetical protein